jgi:GalNAc5-diNAcBac-PP-undecaprenol beta-1,3-glucosyltransferase
MTDRVTSPFFSIVIPSYNRQDSVQSTINSILTQSFNSYEVIVVDDGSTDNTFEVLTGVYADQPAVKIIHQENKERGAARNYGLSQARGKYVEFLDSDDLLLEDHLKLLSDKICELNFPDFICTKFELFRDGKSYPSDIHTLPEDYYNYSLFLSGNPLACNICVRRENADLHLFEEDRSYSIKEDWMFMLQNLRYNRVYIIDKVSIRMNDHDDRSMRSDNKLIVQRTLKAQEWIVKNVPLDTEEKKALEAHCNYFCSIHSYIENDRKNALTFIRRSIDLMGFKKIYSILLLKIIVGKKLMDKIKSVIR